MSRIKLFVSDLDGTLLNTDIPNGEVPKELKKAVKSLRDNGIYFTIATGRPLKTTAPIAEQLGVDIPLITNNGAVVSFQDGKLLSFNGFEFKDWLALIEKLDESVTCISYTEKDIILIKEGLYLADYEQKENFKIDRNKSFLELTKVTKIALIGEISILREFWSNCPYQVKERCRSMQSEDNYLEIVSKKTNKGKGLSQLIKFLDIEQKSSAAIGNQMNDVELLQTAGISYAVNNAVDELKEIADNVTKGEYTKGVIEVIESILH